MPLHRATTYLKNVIEQKEIIPFRRFMGGVGRHAQAKVHGTSQGKIQKENSQIFTLNYEFHFYIHVFHAQYFSRSLAQEVL